MTIRPKQAEFISDFTSPFLDFIGGYRSGKTWGGAEHSILLCLKNSDQRSKRILAISPTIEMSRDILKPTLIEVMDNYGLTYNYVAQDNKFIIPLLNNAEILLRSGDKPERIKGKKCACVWLDETGQMKKEIWDIAIARRNDNSARFRQIFSTTTPEGFNWYYNVLQNEKLPHTVINGSPEEIKLNAGEDYIEMLKANYDVLLQQEKIEGKFINTTSGRVYYGFNRGLHVIDSYQPDEFFPICVFCDFNINPCAWGLLQYKGGEIIVFDELIVNSANTQAMCVRLKDKLKEIGAINSRDEYTFSGLHFYGDYTSIKQRNTATSYSDWEIIKSEFKNFPGYKEKLQSNPKVKDSINIVNNLYEKNKAKVTKNCKYLIRDFEQVVWSENGVDIEKKKNPELTHISDAFRYYAAKDHPLVKSVSRII